MWSYSVTVFLHSHRERWTSPGVSPLVLSLSTAATGSRRHLQHWPPKPDCCWRSGCCDGATGPGRGRARARPPKDDVPTFTLCSTEKGFSEPRRPFLWRKSIVQGRGVETRGRSPRCRVRRTLKRSVGQSTSWHGLMWSEEKHRRTCTVLAEDRTEDGHWSCQLSCSDSRTLSKLDFLGKDCFFFTTSLLLQKVKIMTTTNWCLTLIL